jgi:MFS family permease
LALPFNKSVLRSPTIRAILVAEGISALGSQMSFVALPWFVLMASHSATRMGFVLGAQVLPVALLGIPSAAVVQRLGVRRTLLIADACRAPLLAAVPVTYHAGLRSFPLLLAVVFGVGVFTAPYMSAQRLLIPETFADDETAVVKGNAAVEGVIRLAMLLGPATAGLAIMALGARNVLYVDALSYLVSFAILWRGLPTRRPVRSPVAAGALAHAAGAADTAHVGTATVDRPVSTVESSGLLGGVRFVFADPLLRRVTLAAFVFGFFFPPLLASLPVLALQRYGGDSRVAGLLLAAMGLGALLGTIVVIPLAKVPAMLLGTIGAIGLAAPLWCLVMRLEAWQFALVMLVCGLFTPILNAPVLTQIMLRSPDELRPKVLTFVLTTNQLAGPVAFALTGPALDRLGLTAVYFVIAVGVTGAATLLALVHRVPAN